RARAESAETSSSRQASRPPRRGATTTPSSATEPSRPAGPTASRARQSRQSGIDISAAKRVYHRYVDTDGIHLPRLTQAERKQRTRAELVSTARNAFLERGFHGASLDEIAEEAGYSKGAVYSNFAGKDDLFLAVLDAQFE